MATGRVLAIGIDAADVDDVLHRMRSGALPCLAALHDGARRWSVTNDGYWRGDVWSEFLSGGTEKRYATAFDPRTYGCRQPGAPATPPFWASDDHVRAVSFDVPATRPDRRIPGTVVSGWGTHATVGVPSSQPRGLLTEVHRRYGPGPAFQRYGPRWDDTDAIPPFAADLCSSLSLRPRILASLLSEADDWNFAITVISELHSAGEFAWHAVDRDHPLHATAEALSAGACLDATYAQVDRAVGEMVTAADGDVTVAVFSVVGMRRNDCDVPAQWILPELLYRLATGHRIVDGSRDHDSWVAAGGPVLGHAETLSRPAHRLAGEGALSWVNRRVTATRPGRLVRRLTEWGPRRRWAEHPVHPNQRDVGGHGIDSQPATWYRHAWPHMPAFALPTFGDGLVRINVAGRERKGTIPADRFADELTRVERELKRATISPTGQVAVRAIERLRDDPWDEPEAPADLRVIWHDDIYAIRHPTVGTIGPFPADRSGGHRPEGFLWVAAPSAAPGEAGAIDAGRVPGILLDLVEPTR